MALAARGAAQTRFRVDRTHVGCPRRQDRTFLLLGEVRVVQYVSGVIKCRRGMQQGVEVYVEVVTGPTGKVFHRLSSISLLSRVDGQTNYNGPAKFQEGVLTPNIPIPTSPPGGTRQRNPTV